MGSHDTENKGSRDKPTIYLLDPYPPEVIEHCQTLFHTVLCTDPDIVNWREKADAVLARESLITGADVEQAVKLRACGKQGTGLDNIDQEACKSRGIAVLNTPGLNAQAVAELVLGLTLSVARQIGSVAQRHGRGETVERFECQGRTLSGGSIGIIGMGAIGKRVAHLFGKGFGCTIYAYDPYMPPDAWSETEHIRVAMIEDMLPHVDVLTVHVPLTEDTRGLIGYAQMQKMKSSAILVNAARGGIVNEADLRRALDEGLIWGAGLDCHEHEPPSPGRYQDLWRTGRVVSTPHVGAIAEGLQVKMGVAVIDRMYEAMKRQ